ncbi:GAF and ANTAR domain-containing protein [Pseudarthrobacter sp. BRE9]|uniref:GAF and ANTAR domain-containing protein n=1 Tax=Pseudarthrobacter sp. BRE9 TaxID=2962582 RepID=UPI002880DE9A|nr:GAF and ANTAR domain-containing protein [Pseudarthrobacter sp. BRE9]MDT0169030.1 GAF and ANTAR domain-containing protein [Pseudarthrobacter sp. BRE9]
MLNAGVPENEDFADVALHLQESFLQNPEVEAFLQDLAAYAADRLGGQGHVCSCEIAVLRPKKPAAAAGSNCTAQLISQLEFRLGDGPGATAMRTAKTVLVRDLRREERWPEYVQAVQKQGFRSVLSIPAALEGDAQGVITFHCSQPLTLGSQGIAAAEAFVRQASKGLTLALRMLKLEETRDGMSAAMQTRTVIDLATGAIMAQNRCSQAAAFKLLRDASSTRNMKLRDVAAAVVASVAGAADTFTYFDE